MKARLLIRFMAMAVVLLAVFAAVVPTFAALDGEIINISVNEAECYMDVTVQVEDAGFYAVNYWDDGTFHGGAGAPLAANQIMTVRMYIGGAILPPTIGVYLEDGFGVAATFTYDDIEEFLWSDSAGQACAQAQQNWGAEVISITNASVSCPNPLPAGSVVYSVPAGALTFYAADASTYTGFNLPAGDWYISEFGADFAKVWIACQADQVYIPVENVVR